MLAALEEAAREESETRVTLAGTANLVNLLDLRPGRALKAACIVSAPLLATPGADGEPTGRVLNVNADTAAAALARPDRTGPRILIIDDSAVARAAPATPPSLCRGRRRQRREAGWAACWLGRPAGWAAQGGAQVSFSLLFFFLFSNF